MTHLVERGAPKLADGVLGAAQLNAADFMVAPSLALILYRPEIRPMFEGRPALELVDRLLPEPAWTPSGSSMALPLREDFSHEIERSSR